VSEHPEGHTPGGAPQRAQAGRPEIAARYQLRDRLGFGGMSTVYLAFDKRLERRVAVKLLAEHLAEDPTFVSRFQREAQAAARLIHPNIVQVFDSGQDERSGQYFIVMEYIEGSSCAEILRDDGWIEVDEAVTIIEQACEGLHYAHRHGVVHRDVKPGNLLRSCSTIDDPVDRRSVEVKLADFGIAKATEQSSITQIGSVLGTAAYLAPEQARGEEAGPRADLYALGVVTYQLISGRLPYEAASLTELALKQQQEEPAMLDSLVAAVTPQLADAVAIALALDPRERYESAREMGRAINDGALGIPPAEHRSPSRGVAHATEATSVLASATRAHERSSPRGGAVVPRQPRRGPARTPAPVVASTARPRRRSGARRLLSLAVALLALGGLIAAIVVLSAPEPTTIRLRNVVYEDAKESAEALKQLVEQNTR
jgi:eukaryotic-like serine/threonine-protein kinase